MVKFWDEGHLYSNCLFYILTIYRKCLLFQFLDCAVCMQIPILREVQKERITCSKNGRILKKKIIFDTYFRRWRSLVS